MPQTWYEEYEATQTAQFEPIEREIHWDSPGSGEEPPPEFGACTISKSPDNGPPPRSSEEIPYWNIEPDDVFLTSDVNTSAVNNNFEWQKTDSTKQGLYDSSFPVPDRGQKNILKTKDSFEELLKSMRSDVATLAVLKKEIWERYFSIRYEDLPSYPSDSIHGYFGKIPRSEVTVIAGNTGNGKTEFTKSIVIRNAEEGKKVLAFLTEDTENGFVKRIVFRKVNEKLANLGRKPIKPIDFFQRKEGKDTNNDGVIREAWEETEELMHNVILAKISLNGAYLNDMLRIARKLWDHIDLVVVDTIQSMTGIKPDGKDEDMRRTLIQTMMDFSRLASEKNFAVLMISHITREASKDDELTLDSLYGASEIAKIASTVIGIKKIEDCGSANFPCTSELSLLKSRIWIPKEKIKIGFNPHTTKYSEVLESGGVRDDESTFESDALSPPITPEFLQRQIFNQK